MKPNAELAYRVLDHIDAHPEQWDQSHWWSDRAEIWPGGAAVPTCGTSGCFAGWAVHLSGEQVQRGYVNGEAVWNRAAQLLGFGGENHMDGYAITQADNPSLNTSLFCGSNTRDDLGRLVAEIFGPRPEATS